jgi:hypothetical protein
MEQSLPESWGEAPFTRTIPPAPPAHVLLAMRPWAAKLHSSQRTSPAREATCWATQTAPPRSLNTCWGRESTPAPATSESVEPREVVA